MIHFTLLNILKTMDDFYAHPFLFQHQEVIAVCIQEAFRALWSAPRWVDLHNILLFCLLLLDIRKELSVAGTSYFHLQKFLTLEKIPADSE